MKTMAMKSHRTLMVVALKYIVSFSLLHLFPEDSIFLFSELHPNSRTAVWWLLCWKTETRVEWRLYDRCNIYRYFLDWVHLWPNVLVVCPCSQSLRFCWSIVIQYPFPSFHTPYELMYSTICTSTTSLCWGDMFPTSDILAQMHSFSVLVCCPCTFQSISVALHRRTVAHWHVLYLARIVSSHLSFWSHCKSTPQFQHEAYLHIVGQL